MKFQHSQLLVLVSAPSIVFHFTWFPTGLSAACVVGWILVFFISRHPALKPPELISSLIGLIVFIATFAAFDFSFSLDLCVALVAVLLSVKPLEARTRRDYQVTLLMAYFSTFVSIIYCTTLFGTVYLFASALAVTAAFAVVSQDRTTWPASLRLTLRMAAEAIPLAALLFFLFPRVQGSLWSFGPGQRGKSGFTESFRIDDIRSMSLRHEPAFRVRFDGTIPESSERYWRGIVFSSFDGTNWQWGGWPGMTAYRLSGGTEYTYSVILEPHFSHWLFALDLPVSAEHFILADHTLRTRRKVRDKLYYRVTSRVGMSVAREPDGRPETVALPEEYNPQARALAQRWRASGSAQEIVHRAIRYYTENEFTYSLRAPSLGRNAIDEFLFETRTGYCEHYASSFAFLMRAAGVPARIVGGYLGGEMNPLSDYMIVRHSDAHVWVEIYNDDNRWERVDPTAFVAPARVTGGLTEAVDSAEIPFLRNQQMLGELWKFWYQAYLRIDAVNFAWATWMESYTPQAQQHALRGLGLNLQKIAHKVVLICIILAALTLTAVVVLFRIRLRQQTKPHDEVAKTYVRFLKKLARHGVHKPSHMGPNDLRNSLIHLDQYTAASEILDIYEIVRYTRNPDERLAKTLKNQVARFR